MPVFDRTGASGVTSRRARLSSLAGRTTALALLGATLCVGALACGGGKTPTASTTSTTSTPKIASNPCGAGGTVQLAVGATGLFDCSTGGTTLTLAGAGASYMVVTQFASDQGALNFIPYRARSGSAAAAASARWSGSASLAAPLSGFGSPLLPIRRNPAQMAADRAMLGRARQQASAVSASQLSVRARASRVHAAVLPTPAAGSIRAFHVASSMTVNTYATVTTRLAYAGTNLLLYVDTLAPAGGFTAAQLQAYGQLFDQTLYPLDTAAFGSPSDVDNNGHFIMVMTPQVNADTPKATCNTSGFVAGFFDPTDFVASDPNSNQGEVFYSIVPDPNATVSCAHTVADVGLDVPATFLHELEHLIAYSQHSVLRSGAPLVGWLDEGLAIVGEELGSLYYEQKCPPPACRTNAAQMFPDSSQGFISSFLYDSYQYALLPDTAGLLVQDDSNDGFSWRGGAWLLARYIADQYGKGALRAIASGSANGAAAIAAATGQSFPTLFANFGLALYTDSLPGLARTTAPAVNRFTSRNLRSLWARLYATSSGTSVPTASPLILSPLAADSSTLIMYPGTMAYWRVDTPASSAAVTLQFSTPTNTALSSTLHPQFTVYRLPAGQ